MPKHLHRLATITALSCAAPSLAAPKVPTAGEVAPDFTLTLIDGSRVTAADLKGQVVILNFWATWCAPCRKELPLLDAYYRKFKDKGLVVYAVTTEDSVPLAQLKSLFSVMAIPSVRKVKGPYRVGGAVPTNMVIGRDGTVRYVGPGAFDLPALNALVQPLLNEHPAIPGGPD